MRHSRATGLPDAVVVEDGADAVGVPVVAEGEPDGVLDGPDVGVGAASGLEVEVEVGALGVVLIETGGLPPPGGWHPARSAVATSAPITMRGATARPSRCMSQSPRMF